MGELLSAEIKKANCNTNRRLTGARELVAAAVIYERRPWITELNMVPQALTGFPDASASIPDMRAPSASDLALCPFDAVTLRRAGGDTHKEAKGPFSA